MNKYGTTFSIKYCHELGLDWQKTFISIAELFKGQTLRICAYWDTIEPRPGEYIFEELEWQLAAAAKFDISIILALGRKVPRWPEFHEPKWALTRDYPFLEDNLLNYVDSIVRFTKRHKHIMYWQVENEPFWSFGHSRFAIHEDSVAKEINVVKALDDRPILVTDTGEWSDLKKAALHGDLVGINIYQTSYNSTLRKYNHNNFTPGFYNSKVDAIDKPVIIAELQAEPWGPTHVSNLAQSEVDKSISIQQLNNNIALADKIRCELILLWGAEWWIFMNEKHGDTRYLSAVVDLVST